MIPYGCDHLETTLQRSLLSCGNHPPWIVAVVAMKKKKMPECSTSLFDPDHLGHFFFLFRIDRGDHMEIKLVVAQFFFAAIT